MKSLPRFTQSSLTIIMGVLLSACHSDPVSKPSEFSVRPVNTIQLQGRQQLLSQRFTGVVRSQHTSNLSFRVQGTLIEILVDEGEYVKKGQVLARLDPHDFQVDVNRLKAQLREANAAYKLAKTERKRTGLATSDNAIAHINLDRALTAEETAAANVELLKQSLLKAQDALKYTRLVAPFDGVVAKRFIDNYEQTLPTQKIMTIHQPEKLEVIASVPERKLHLLHLGDQAQVSWFGADNSELAKVTKIASIPDPLTRTYDVTFAINSESSDLVPGKAVNVELESELSQATFCIPSMAVNGHHQMTHIVKSVDNKALYIPVTVSRAQGEQLCVSGELAVGDIIATSGSAYLKEGDEIKVVGRVRG